MKVVLDANVLIAAFATHGLCEAIFEVCLDRYELVLSEHLLRETEKNLRKKLKLPASVAKDIAALLRDSAAIRTPTDVPADACRDSDDLAVLGLAAAAKADFIVTGDQDLLVLGRFGETRIVSPRAFSEIIHGSQ